MSTDNQTIVLKYDIVKRLTDSYSAVRIKHLWGLVDNEDNILMRPVYDYIDIENGTIWARFRGEKFYLKNEALPLIYDHSTKINDYHFIVTIGYKKGVIDALGQNIIPTEYIDIRFYNNYYWCQKNGLEGYRIYSLSGKLLSDHYYKYVYDSPIIESNFPENRKNIDFPIVQSETKFNILNAKLEEVIPGKARLISRLEHRQQKKKYGFEFEYVKSCFAVISFNIGCCLYNFSTEEFCDIIYSKIDYKGKLKDGHEYVYCYRSLQKVCLEEHLNSSSNEINNESTGIEALDNYLNTEAYIKSHSSIVDIYNENGYILTINIDENKIRSQLHDCTLVCQKKSTKKYGVVSKLGIIVPYRYDYIYKGEDECKILIAQVGFNAKMNQSFYRSRKDLNAECEIYNFQGKCISQGINLREHYVVSENEQCFSVKGGHEFKYYNLDGDIIASSKVYSKINLFNAYGTTIAIDKAGKYGIISNSGNVIVSFDYDKIFQTKISYNVYIGVKDNKYSYMFLSNGKVIVTTFRDIECPRSLDRDEELFTNNVLFIVQNSNKKWGVVNSSIGVILECKYKKEDIYIINQNAIIIAPYGEKRKCIDQNGQEIPVTEALANKMNDICHNYYLYGLRCSTGDIVSQEKYAQINQFENGFAVARNSEDKWGFIDFNGDELCPFEFTYVSAMGADGEADVTMKDCYGVIDRNGKFLHKHKYKIHYNSLKSSKYFLISEESKCGLICRSDHSLIIPCKYDSIDGNSIPCDSGYIVVYNDDKAGVVNLEHPHDIMISCKYDKICLFDRNKYPGDYKGHIYQCFKEDVIDYYSHEGRLLFSINKIYDILLVTEDVIVYKDESADIGITIRQDGVDDYICDNIGEYNTKYIQVHKNGAWGIYSIENKCESIPCVYYKSQEPSSWISSSNPFKYFIFDNSQSLVPIEKDGCYGYIDINNVIKIPTVYNLAKGFREGAAPIKVNDKWGYINHMGQVIIPFLFDDADLFYDGLACIKWGETYGYFNINGDMIIPPLDFTVASQFKEGLARVEDKYHWGYVAKDGTLVNWKEKKTPNYNSDDNKDWERESWYAMTDGMYGDYDGYCGDYDFLGR